MTRQSPSDQNEIVDAVLVVQHHDRGSLWVERCYHIAILLIVLVILVLSFLMRVEGTEWVYMPFSKLPLVNSCTTRQLFNIDCPGCGLTRSFICMSRGDWAAAFQFNFGGPWLYLFFVGQIPWRCFQLWKMYRYRISYYSPWLFAIPILLLSVLIIQWAIKLF